VYPNPEITRNNIIYGTIAMFSKYVFLKLRKSSMSLYRSKLLLLCISIILSLVVSIFSYLTFYENSVIIFKNANAASSSSSCPPCVIFRIDDISDIRPSASIAVMNLFLAENAPLTVGIVMNHIGKNPALMEKILEGKDKGLLELALHGYDHVYYTKLSPQEQLDQLSNANQRMHSLFFSKPSNIFIPPYDVFNNYTIDAMTKLGIRILSAGEFMYPNSGIANYPIFSLNNVVGNSNKSPVDNNNNQIIHMPRSTGFESFGDDGKSTRLPVTQILNEASSHISKYGYSVIVMHPTSFLVMQNGKYTKTVDEKEIDDLKTLIESIKSKNIHIVSFSKLAGMSG
jgi:peptidoglycan/xylan/chitin deacetylase (PgdA/CDA1 family)